MTTPRTTPLLVAALLAACSGGGDQRGITLAIEGAGGRTAYFDHFVNGAAVRADSVRLDAEGKGFIRTGPLRLDFYRIALSDEDMLIVATDSTDNLVVEARAGAISAPTRVSGSPHTEALHAFYAETRAYERERDSLRSIISANPGDTGAIARLNTVNAAYHGYCKDFVAANSASPAALAVEPRLDFQREFALFKKVRDELRQSMSASGFYRAFRQKVDNQEQMEIAMRLQEEEMARLSNLLPEGSEAPEIRQQTPDGGTFALSQLRGKYVLIDFWASWCRPCRIENPAMKRVYDKYHRKGFEILGVSLDRDHDAWVGAIKADGLPWKHVSDLGFWNNAAAQEYSVSSIPYTVLLDPEGRVIVKGLRSEGLDQKLAELFGS